MSFLTINISSIHSQYFPHEAARQRREILRFTPHLHLLTPRQLTGTVSHPHHASLLFPWSSSSLFSFFLFTPFISKRELFWDGSCALNTPELRIPNFCLSLKRTVTAFQIWLLSPLKPQTGNPEPVITLSYQTHRDTSSPRQREDFPGVKQQITGEWGGLHVRRHCNASNYGH